MTPPPPSPRRDPLNVPADELRQRIRLALSVLGHRDPDRDLLAGVLRGTTTLAGA